MKFEIFEKRLGKCLQESIFMLNNIRYQQIDSVSMGSLLSSIMAYIFMNIFENRYRKIC